MYIDCTGMVRSGSTLQYNIVSNILELKNKGVRLEWQHHTEFNLIKDKHESNLYSVFKNHYLTEEMINELKTFDGSSLIYVYRDIRDVCVSLMQKEKKTFEQVFASKVLHKAIDEYYKVINSKLPHYKQAYEVMFLNTKREIKRLSNFLDIELSIDEIDTIYEEVSFSSQKEKIQKYQEQDDFTVKKNQKFNAKTLLHHNHIADGEIGKYKKHLSKEQIVKLESEFRVWLLENNYSISKSDKNEKPTDLKKYYSQHGEDFLLWEFFDHKAEGYFIEVGAFDGIHLSNTYSFEQQGWQGICVEPGIYFEQCKANRKRSKCFNVACVASDDIKELTFFQEELGLLSSVQMDSLKVEDIKSRYKNRNLEFKGVEEYTVQCSTLNSILLNNSHQIDFVTIDVEGAELEVLKGFDLANFTPRVIVIEANDTAHKAAIIEYMTVKNEYIFTRELGVNLFFVRNTTDFTKLRSFDVNCVIEKQLHPRGIDFTLKGFEEGIEIVDGKRKVNKVKSQKKLSKVILEDTSSNSEQSMYKAVSVETASYKHETITLPSDDFINKKDKVYRLNSDASPVLIYQVGKVGSSTIFTSLKNVITDVPVYQVHNISNAQRLLNGEKAKGYRGGIHHFSLGEDLRKIIDENKDLRWKVIVGVREPIKRWVSDIFQNLNERYDFLLDSYGQLNKDAFLRYVRTSMYDEPMQYWFEDELETTFGINILENDFDKSCGYQILKHKNVDILVYQLETLGDKAREIFDEFLALKNFSLVDSNKSVSKDNAGKLYLEILDELKFDQQFLDNYYDSNKIVQHFYSTEAINEFKSSWLANDDMSPSHLIIYLQSTIKQKESDLLAKNQLLKKKNDDLRSKEEVIKNKNKKLDSLHRELKHTEAQLKLTEAQLRTTEAQLRTTEDQLKSTEAQLKSTEAQLKSKDELIKSKSRELVAIKTSKKYKLATIVAAPYVKLLSSGLFKK